MDAERDAWFVKRTADVFKESPHGESLRRLHEGLLRVGGQHAVLPIIEEDIRDILGKWRVWARPKTLLRVGERSRCHQNSGNLWDVNRRILKLCTGYALSDDGCWRPHSWCWWPSRQAIVETTERRLAYVGFCMTKDQAERFWNDNCL